MNRKSTKEYLMESLLELGKTKPFDHISVCEIALNCGMTARTFYNHFQDKYDLILWTYASKMEGFIHEQGEQLSFSALFHFLASLFLENRHLYLSAFEDLAGRESFIIAISDYSARVTEEYLCWKYHIGKLPDELSFQIRYFYHGGFFLGFRFLNRELPLSLEIYLDYILASIPEPLKHYLFDSQTGGNVKQLRETVIL